MVALATDLNLLKKSLRRLRGDPETDVDASIVIPVNAAKDLDNVLRLLSDLGNYAGEHQVELILVVNNYAAEQPPNEIEKYRQLGLTVISIPRVEHKGGVALAARIPGIQRAQSQSVLLFDADCRIPNADALLDWYIAEFENGCDLAYTHVEYTDLQPGISIKVRMLIHHGSRWFRRTILGIPTSRGSNYAIRKDLILQLFSEGRVTYDIHIGPAVKKSHGKIVYSGARELTVYTSGRFFAQGWKVLISYLIWRTGYYFREFKLKSKSAVMHQ
jgi:glycosyltransferase involved in cell wall biosynthesis